MKYYEQGDIIKKLAERMGNYLDGVEDFNPYEKPEHDYLVLTWLRDVVRLEYISTWTDFVSYISGPMHAYVVGDYVKAAIFAIGIIDISKK